MVPTTRMHAKTLTTLALLGLLTLAPGAQGRTMEMTVYLHDNPLHAAPDAMNAQVGDEIVLTVVNQGTGPHNLVVCGDGVGSSGACQDKWGFTPMLQPNQEAKVTFTATEAGTFEYYCDIPGHKAGGMVGRLQVQGEEAPRNESPLPGLPLVVAALAVLALVRARRR